MQPRHAGGERGQAAQQQRELMRLNREINQSMHGLRNRPRTIHKEVRDVLDAMQQQVQLIGRMTGQTPSSTIEPTTQISISVEGAAFTSDSNRRLAEQVSLHIELADLSPAIETDAQVVRIAKAGSKVIAGCTDGAEYLVAVRFTDLEAWQERHLQRFLHHQQRLGSTQVD